jgi:hypothetical protein
MSNVTAALRSRFVRFAGLAGVTALFAVLGACNGNDAASATPLAGSMQRATASTVTATAAMMSPKSAKHASLDVDRGSWMFATAKAPTAEEKKTCVAGKGRTCSTEGKGAGAHRDAAGVKPLDAAPIGKEVSRTK